MSELRMYVEHLFEGRVLTAEMIELKEEIYGNLVARYEDYVASGMSEAEALARAKASITSIDDVLAGDDDASGEPAGAAKEEPAVAAAPSSTTAQNTAAEQPAPATVVMPAAGDAGGATEQVGATAAGIVPPAQPAGAPAEKKASWTKVLAIAVAVIAVILVATVVWNVVLEPGGDYIEDTVEDVVDVSTPGAGQNGQGATTGGNNASTDATDNQPTFSDPEDQREYEATSTVLGEIDGHDCTGLQVYSGESQPSASFFESLPLGSYVVADDTASIDATSFTVYYANVPEDIDGDAIDRALVYNAVAAFSVYPNLETLNITVQEQHDASHDAESYSFTRGHLESAFANASDDAIVQFNSSLFESETSWDVVRQQIDRHEFCEHQADIAEIG